MSLAPFSYQPVDTWAAAVELLRSWGDDAKIIAGGQSLVPMLNLGLAAPAALIDVNPVPAPEPHRDGDTLVLPALTRHQTVLRSRLVGEVCPLLPTAVAHVGNVRVRTRGTIGGSACHAEPTGEIPCVLRALRARLVVLGPAGQRTVDVAEFFQSYLTTTLEPDEVVTEIHLPVAGTGCGWAFDEKVRRASDFATVEVVATARVAPDGLEITGAELVLGGVAETPVAVDAELLAPLLGTAGEQARLRAVARAVAASIEPESDVRASADYRRRLTEVLTARTLAEAIDRARGGDR